MKLAHINIKKKEEKLVELKSYFEKSMIELQIIAALLQKRHAGKCL